MKERKRFTDREWEDLASILSEEKDQMSDLFNRFLNQDSDGTGKLWMKLKNMNINEEIDVDKAWKRVYTRMSENTPEVNEESVKILFFRGSLIRLAATVLIFIGLAASALYLNRYGYLTKNISVISGEDLKNIQVTLPDGSRIYLNRNSELSYKKNYGHYGRDVKLKGEAFFEIVPDKLKPFTIDASNARVKVVGTSFNVISNNSESAVEVYVKSGKVLLSDNSGSKTIQLDPGFVGTMNSTTSAIKVNDDPNYDSWKTGYLFYKGEKLRTVFKDLKRAYNMDITADDTVILNSTWRSPIDNLDEETIIKLICTSFNLGYTKDGNVFHLEKK